MEHARELVNSILLRSWQHDGSTPESSGVSARLSTLEQALEAGGTLQRFWSNMSKVRTF